LRGSWIGGCSLLPELSNFASPPAKPGDYPFIYNPVPDDPAQWAEPAVGREPSWQARYLASLELMAAVGAVLTTIALSIHLMVRRGRRELETEARN